MSAVITTPGRWLPGAALLRTSEFNAIPAMTDPMGKHWDQPAYIRMAPMDATHVVLTTKQIAGLLEYSRSLPSGKYDGKCWLSIDRDATKWLRWYEPDAEPGMIAIASRIIIEVQ